MPEDRRLALSWAVLARAWPSLALVRRRGHRRRLAAAPRSGPRAIADTIKCPTCRSQSVADSDAPRRRRSATEIARRIDAGQTDAEIRAYFVEPLRRGHPPHAAGLGAGGAGLGAAGGGLVLGAAGLGLVFGAAAGGTGSLARRRPAPGRDRSGPGRPAALEEQRSFLLRSLDDLDREYAAGDVDESTTPPSRTTMPAGRPPGAGDRRGQGPLRRRPPAALAGAAIVAVVALVAFAVLAGVVVARSAGRRDPRWSITGADPRSETRQALAECSRLSGLEGQALEALQCYDVVLAQDPGNPEALTYRGVLLILASLVDEGVGYLEEAVAADPDYPDAHAFLAIVHNNRCEAEEALAELDTLERLDPPARLLQETDGIRENAEAQLDGTRPCTSLSSMPPASPATTAEERGEDRHLWWGVPAGSGSG